VLLCTKLDSKVFVWMENEGLLTEFSNDD
jgi:hypothetical protein